MKTVALIITMLMLSACVTPSTDAQPERNVELIQLSSSGVKSLESAVSDTLKDPSSAQFGQYIAFSIIDEDGTITTGACGYVNAKNSYGGYGGMTPYSALGANETFVYASISEYAMTVCKQMYGVSI